MATAQATDLILTTFDPPPFQLIQKIPVRVRPVEDSFVASFVNANVNASGETAQDAVENLKDLMAALFETLGALPRERLGTGPARQLAALQAVLRKKS